MTGPSEAAGGFATLGEWLLRADPGTVAIDGFPSVALWWKALAGVRGAFVAQVDRAAACGLVSRSVGAAFAAGYQAALRALVVDPDDSRLAALCVTEPAGNRPSAIETSLRPLAGEAGGSGRSRLEGQKSFVTLGGQAQLLLVAASEGRDPVGRNRLAVVRVDPSRRGVSLTDLPPLPLVPDVPHAAVSFAAVEIDPEDRLAGDGYLRYVKPFRTVEDVHVVAAILAYLLGAARSHGWPEALRERLLGLVARFRALALEPPLAPAVHLALAGALADVRLLLRDIEPRWEAAPEAAAADFRRDVRLLEVASAAREARRIAAWRVLAGGGPGGPPPRAG